MSDERFDDAIREALLADDPGAVPTRLRSRMAMIPDEAAGQTAAPISPWRERFNRYALPLGVMAAAAVIVIVFGSIALRGQQVASVAPSVPSLAPSLVPPTVAPSAGESAPIPSTSVTADPSAGASGPPSTDAPTPSAMPSGPLSIDPAKVIALSDGTFALVGDTPPVAYFRWQTDTVSEPLLGFRSLTGDARKNVVWLKNGHDIGDHAVTDTGFVWMETWYTDPPIDCGGRTGCGEHQGQPISWALNFTTMAGKTTKVDSGVVSRLDVGGEGASAVAPTMTVDGDRVAYAVPAPKLQVGSEESLIIVRSLSTREVLWQLDTAGYVAEMALTANRIIYRETGPSSAMGDPGDTSIVIHRTDFQGTPTVLAHHVSQMAVGDGGSGPVRIAYTTSQPDDGVLHVANADGSSPHDVAPPTAGMTTAYSPTIIGDGYVWKVQQQDAQGAWTGVTLAWRPGWDGARPIPALGAPDWMSSSNGNLLFSGGDVPVLKGLVTGSGGTLDAPVGAISAADLFGK